jgi:RHS repeat-associated protein
VALAGSTTKPAITTQQWNGTAYVPADSWSLGYKFPPTGDSSAPALWLNSITRTGSDTTTGGSAAPLPAVTFTPVQLANRLNPGNYVPLVRERIGQITTETGAGIAVTYEQPNQCSPSNPPAPSSNTKSCFPVYWGPFTSKTSPDWFVKYAVQSVSVSDPTGGSNGLYTSYQYAGPAWHYDDNELVMPKYRTYGQWRGYQDVKTYTGTGTDAQTESETTYYQGMSDDNNSTAVTLTDSQGGQHDDTNQLAGDPLETTAYNFKGGPVDHSTIDSYWVSAPAATRTRSGLPDLTANATGLVETWARQAITDTGTTTWRKTETDTSYDATPSDPFFGLPLFVFSHGDLSDTTQQTCTTTTYAPANTSENLVGLPAEAETDAAACGGSNPGGASAPGPGQVNALTAPAGLSRPADVISDTRTFYDNPALAQTWPQPASPAWPQAAPTVGDVSVVRVAKGYASGAFTYQTKAATVYDSYGRPVDSYDANGNLTTTGYTMTAGSTTTQAVTNPLGQATTTTLDPVRGLPATVTDPNGNVTYLQYDGLGRLTDVWDHGRTPSADQTTPNEQYAYQVTNSQPYQPAAVITKTLNDGLGYVTSATLYDALLRVRQTQFPTPQGGILVNDNLYDSRGWLQRTNTNWWDSGANPGPSIVNSLPDSQLPNYTSTSFDGLGRPVLVTSYDDSAVKSTTATAYYGDRVTTVPPTGGTPTSTVTDALGRTTELDSYASPPTVNTTTSGGITTVTITGGTTQATDYAYNHRGWLSGVTDAATGEQWSRTYNLLGQVTSAATPNSGTTSMSYDANGNLTGVTDAKNNPITYTYDALNRKTGEYDGPSTASPQLASWVYDNANNVAGVTNPVGHLTTETSYSGGHAYTIQQTGFNSFGESTGETVTLPAAEGALYQQNGYTLGHTYSTNAGLLLKDTYPASPGGGALPGETVTHGYETGFDLPGGLGSTLAAYGQQMNYTAFFQVAQEEIGSLANNAYVTSTYDPHTGNLTDTQVQNTTVQPSAPYDDTKYTYDPYGNLTAQTNTRTTSGGTHAETQCFGYDTLDRLTQAWTATDNCAADPSGNGGATVGDQITGGAYWTTWAFDPLGDWTKQTQHSLTGGQNTVTSYTYNGNGTSQPNTLTATSTTGPSGPSSASYAYDPDGNTTTRTLPAGNQALTWTHDGKLGTDTTPAGTTSYIYDADGNLLLQKDPGQTTLYLFGGAEQIFLNTANGTITGTRFIPLPGGPVVVRTGAGTAYSFELGDQHHTSLLTLDNTAANPVWRQFTPYGNPRGQAPPSWPDANGFLGKPADTSTGLTTVGARQYDPATGRFLSVDPVLNTTAPQTMAGYTYAAGNPATNADPTGLCPSTLCGGIPQPGAPHHRMPATTYTPCESGCQAPGPPGSVVLPPAARPTYAHFMDTWQPGYGDVGIQGLLSSLDTFCGNNINLCGSHLTATIWTTYLASSGIGIVGPAGRQLIGQLVNAEITAESNIVYRVIRADENPALGLTAKDPLATYTPEGHVLNGSRPGFASQYISTTRELRVAEKWAAISGDRIVGINLDAVDGPVINLSTPAGRELYLNGITARNFAAASSEVLVEGSIPPEAVFEVPPIEEP